MEPNKEKLEKWQKLQLILALIATAVLAVMVGTQAWLTYVRRLETAASVDMPNLIIQGPDGLDTAPIELGDIDVFKDRSQQYVFSIVAINATNYRLQLAHTTNIPLTYRIYRAEMKDTAITPGPDEIPVGEHTYCYDRSKPLSGEYLNLKQSNPQKADDTKLGASYGNYGNVHQDAKPLYWESKPAVQVINTTYERHYYVLDVSWNGGLMNNKETDIVYLTVELVKPDSNGE